MQVIGYHGITEEDHASLGRAITSYSAFEHQLLLAIAVMNGAHVDSDPISGEFVDRFVKITLGGFKVRTKGFCAEYRLCRGEDQFIIDFEADMVDAVNMRDQLVHSAWVKLEDGTLKGTFFSREAQRRGRASSQIIISAEKLAVVAEHYLSYAIKISNRFGTG